MSNVPTISLFDQDGGGDDFFSQLSNNLGIPVDSASQDSATKFLSSNDDETQTSSSLETYLSNEIQKSTINTDASINHSSEPNKSAPTLLNKPHLQGHRKALSLTDAPSFEIPFGDACNPEESFFSSLSSHINSPSEQQTDVYSSVTNQPFQQGKLQEHSRATSNQTFPHSQSITDPHQPTDNVYKQQVMTSFPSHGQKPFHQVQYQEPPIVSRGNVSTIHTKPFHSIDTVSQNQPIPLLPKDNTLSSHIPSPLGPPTSHRPLGNTSVTSIHNMTRVHSLPTFSSWNTPGVNQEITMNTVQNPFHPMGNRESDSSILRPRNSELRPHPIMCFGFGGKFGIMFPKQRHKFGYSQPTIDQYVNGHFVIHSLHKMLTNTNYIISLTNFPGPLSSSVSMDRVVKYINEKVTSAAIEDTNDIESSRILWKLLNIVCENYGNISGVDNSTSLKIKELLLERETSWEVSPSPLYHNNRTFTQEEHAVTELQKIILKGSLDEAYRYAVHAQLWSHALLIASNMNVETFRAAITQFAESSLTEGSPLRTLYLLFSGKHQDLFAPNNTGVLERWRDNLTTLLTHRTTNDKGAIGSLGDRLWAIQGRVEAAHFCYTVAEYELDFYDNPNTRIALVGGDHKLRTRSFVNVESIQRTEIMEYARTLGNPQYSVPQIQPYKLVYAYYLAEVGLLDNAKKYCQAISGVVNKFRNFPYNQIFLYQIEQLDYRLGGYSKESPGTSWIPIPKLALSGLFGKFKRSENDPNNSNTSSPRFTNSEPSSITTMKIQHEEPSSKEPLEVKQSPLESPRMEKLEKKPQGSPGGLGSKLSGWFTALKTLGGQADLGDEVAYEYNKEYGLWLPKGQKPDPEYIQKLLGPPAPPPSSFGAPPVSTESVKSGPSSSISPPPEPFTSPVKAPPSVRSSASPVGRRRYVDTFNPAEIAQIPGRKTSSQDSATSNISVFTPQFSSTQPQPEPEPEPVDYQQQTPSNNSD